MPDYFLSSVCLLGCKPKVSIATICPPSGWLEVTPQRLSGRCDKICRTVKHDWADWSKVFHKLSSASLSLLFPPGSCWSKGWRGTSRSSWSSGKFSVVREIKRVGKERKMLLSSVHWTCLFVVFNIWFVLLTAVSPTTMCFMFHWRLCIPAAWRGGGDREL